MKLIKDWRKSWRMFSQQAMAAAISLLGAYGALPEKLQDALPVGVVITLAVVILLFGMIGRVLVQKGVSK